MPKEADSTNSTDKTANVDGTVGKALTLLGIVERFQKPMRFKDILKQSTFPKSSTYRLLQTLVSQGMLGFNADSGHYTLGLRLIRLAYSGWQHASLAPIAASYLDALSARIGETIHLAQLDNGQVLYLDKRNANRPLSMFSAVGKVGPAYCTGVGKVMLAYLGYERMKQVIAQQSFYPHTQNTLTTGTALIKALETIRKEGVAFDREEHEPNIICIAVPILTSNGQVVGGLSITSSTLRTTLQGLNVYKADLQHTAKLIGEHAAVGMLPKMEG